MQANPSTDTDVEYYVGHITAYEREFKSWETRATKIVERYRDDKPNRSGKAKFNVLWSNVQTLKAATFARTPEPDVSRRFKDNDPVGRVAALMLERALEFEVQHYRDFAASIKQCVYDRFLGGRGTAWVRYEPTFKQVESGQAAEEGEQVTEDLEPETAIAEELDYECAPVDYVHWKDFGHAVTRTWEECPIVWRKVYMTRKALTERFGKDGASIPLDASPEETSKSKGSTDSNIQKRALIYEIWDKERGEALWLSKSQGKIIDSKPDPLGLEEFFPCPPPIYATVTTDSLVPLPDFTIYQDQANELDTLSDRIDGLIYALQVKGVYDASVPELARLFKEGQSGDLIPVKNWAALAEKQGLRGGIEVIDLTPIAAALQEAYRSFEQVKAQIYELTGISDILRGDTQASETATAQQIKNSYASMRLKVYQDEVERFAARLLQLKAQIICNHFSDETIIQISAAGQLSDEDKQYIGPALAMLKDNAMRNFRIEVATDSMVYQDEQQEKQSRMEFLQAVSQFLTQAVEAGKEAPQLTPLAIELLKFGVAGFRVGKTMEGTIDQVADHLKMQAQQQAQNPKPDPEMQKTQAQAQADQQKAQMQIQADQQSDQARAQVDMAIASAKAQAEAQESERARQHAAALEQMKAQFADQQAQREDAFNRWKVEMDNATKIEVASLSAKTSLQTAAMSASTDDIEVSPDGTSKPNPKLQDLVSTLNDSLTQMLNNHQDIAQSIQKMQEDSLQPAVIVRGPDGRAIGVQKGSKVRQINRGPDGSIQGIQ